MRVRCLFLLLLLTLGACSQPSSTVNPDLASISPQSPHTQQLIVNNAWLEISQSALDFNTKKILTLLDNKSTLCAILKGDAYGHDLTLVTPVMIKNNVQCIGVASNQEIKTVREMGFSGRLMRVRSATLKEMQQAMTYDVEELIGNKIVAEQLDNIAELDGKNLRIHLALNSGGMSRNGLEVGTEKGLNDAKAIVNLKNLTVVGIMSHYPVENAAEIKVDLARFHQQAALVITTTELKREEIKLHVANTFATLAVPDSWLDMVRVGGVFYGDTIASTEYKRAMTFKSNIASLNRYPEGDTVGYDRTYTLKRDSILANIPVGYADGYRRVFSNAGHVLIHGQRLPVLGKTSMNTVMVDVTDLNKVDLGDEVVLFGNQGNAKIQAEEIEDLSGALFTEMSILWGAANKRILVD